MIRFAAVLLLVVFSASSQSSTWVHGAGNHSCGVWIEEKKIGGSFYHGLVWWVQGKITGMSFAFKAFAEHVNIKNTDHEGIEGFITKHCQENPIDKIDAASYALFLELISSDKK